MRRYEGFLRPEKKRPVWPRHWLIVAVETEPLREGDGRSLRISPLRRYVLLRLDCSGPRCVRRAEMSGGTAGHFWQVIAEREWTSKNLWIMSPRALMAWQLLGLWEKLELGNLRLDVSHKQKRNPSSLRGMGRSAGTLIVQDPPTVGIFRYDALDVTITWVCAGNYGLQPAECGQNAETEAHRLADVVEQCSSVLHLHSLGGWGLTAGSMAWRGWQSSYDGAPLYISSGRQGDALESRAVAGGHLFCRPTGEDPVEAIAVDARSMYPWIATYRCQAVELISRGIGAQDAEDYVYENPLAHMADVEVETDVPIYPQRTERGVVYPVGRFRTVLCGPELEHAVKGDHVRRIHGANWYQLGSPLETYQSRVWSAREDCDGGVFPHASALIKRLGVSLVGKFHQYTDLWEEVYPDVGDPVWGTWQHFRPNRPALQYRARAGVVEVCWGRELSRHAIPSIPLWIWSWGRMRLWSWILAAGVANVYYADTDGLIVSPAGYANLASARQISDGAWGQLRRVAGPTSCYVYGPKNFVLGEKIVKAGRKKTSTGPAVSQDGAAWYRLPWNQLHDPRWSGCWVETVR
jgi:hypothetical protein